MCSIKDNDKLKLLESLIKKGVKINAIDSRGKTVLHYTVDQSKRSLILQTLLKLGAEVDSKNDKGETPLMLVMQEGELEYVEILMKYGADISQANKLVRQH